MDKGELFDTKGTSAKLRCCWMYSQQILDTWMKRLNLLPFCGFFHQQIMKLINVDENTQRLLSTTFTCMQ